MRKLGKCNNHSGQALLEFAIFGAMLLFCLSLLLQYGLRVNYQEYLQMTTFRRALSLALNRSHNNSTNMYSPTVNFTVFHDKSIPNPQDRFGVQQRYPYATSYTVVYTNKMNVEPDLRMDITTNRPYLPGMDMLVNEGTTSSDGWLHPEGITGTPQPGYSLRDTQPGYTTAGWGYLSDPCGVDADGNQKTFRKKISEPLLPDKPWYKWSDPITCDTLDPTTCDAQGKNCKPYVREGVSLDVDGDGVEETLVLKNEGCTYDYDSDTGQTYSNCSVKGYVLFEPNLGDIDLNYAQKNQAGVEVHQGLQPDYVKEQKVLDGTLETKTETPQAITNTWSTKSQEIISRKVLLNDPDNRMTTGGYWLKMMAPTTQKPPKELEHDVKSQLDQDTTRTFSTEF